MIPLLQRWASTWPGIFLFVFITMGVIIPTGFLGDPGTFWHIRTGEWMIDHLQVLRTDPFSQSESDWIPTQWLAEIVMAFAYRFAGFAGVTTLSSILIAAWVSILARRWFLSGMHPILVWFFAILVLMVGAIHFLARPLLINYLGITMVSYFVVDFENRRVKALWLLWYFPLAIFWANCHGGYLGGISILGLAILIWIAQYFFSKGPIKDFKSLLTLSATGVLWLLAPCISPFGIGMYAEWLKIWFKLDLSSYIIEHAAPKLFDVYMLAAYAVFAAVTLFFFISSKGDKYLGITGCVWAWFFLAMKRARNAPIFISASAVMFEEIWLHLVSSQKIREDWIIRQPAKPSKKMLAGSMLIVGGLLLASVLGWHQVQLNPKTWPVDLIEPMQQMALEYGAGTKIYNELNDGGFLIFYSPKWKVFQDDRCEIHAFRNGYTEGGWLKKQFALQLHNPGTLISEIEKKGINLAVVPKETAVSQSLAKTSVWERVFAGKTHEIWVLNRPEL